MTKMIQMIKVGIADLKVTKSSEKLRTSGLGSCVGIVLYDGSLQAAGMAHIMLPDSSLARKGEFNRSKYADTAIEDLFIKLRRAGADSFRLKAKIAGGAQMFQFTPASEMMRIGPRNVEAVTKKLTSLRIPIEAQDVGGQSGRTIEFNPLTSNLHIKTVNKEEIII
ncbi:chemotaxis protein CheD [Halobacillus halophilus]|uniref:chemotaxis protein CheD n=1 Tax=Halobacillus halophilus TaxID=1570 RepID=UPI001CD36686|nr:chemotaxis protein CheD [Halobacillus halophilus]MCA1009257.1 chemotaxis protein CheD [Halobacillus halophilus]